MTPQRVTLITLGVDDLKRSEKFYGDMGWVPVSREESIVFYQMNGRALALFGRKDLAKDQGRPDAHLGTGAITLAQNFRTDGEVDAAYALALKSGAAPMKAPENVFWGGYSGYYADPDGHVWEVAMNPFTLPNSDGSFTMKA